MTRPQTLPRSRKKIFACILAGRTHHVIKIIASVCLESSCHRNLSNGDGEKCMHWSRWKYIFLRYRFRGGLSHRGWSFWHQTYDKTTLDAASIVSIHSIGLEEYLRGFSSGFLRSKVHFRVSEMNSMLQAFLYIKLNQKLERISFKAARDLFGINIAEKAKEKIFNQSQCDRVRSKISFLEFWILCYPKVLMTWLMLESWPGTWENLTRLKDYFTSFLVCSNLM